MLSIKKRSKAVLSVAIASTLVIPAVAIAVNKINSAKDTFATAMPSGFNDQNFYNCVLAEFQTEYPDETVTSTGLTDGQLAKIKTLSCSGENKSDAEKISSASGVEKMTSLISLNLYDNKVQNLDVSNNPELRNLTADDIMVSVGLEKTVDGSASTAEINLTSVKFITNSASNLTIKRTENYVFDRTTAVLSVSNLPATGGYVETEPILEPAYTRGKNFRLKIANISSGGEDSGSMPEGFNDQNFYNCVLTSFRSEFPSETVAPSGLTDTQLAKIVTLSCYDENKPESEKITNTSGLDKMTSLEHLNLENNKIATVDTSHNAELTELLLSSNELTELDVSHNNKLTILYASRNRIASLGRQGLDNNTSLVELSLYQNQLSNINVSRNIDLEELYVHDNKLNSLDVKSNTKLVTIYAQRNTLQSIDVSKNKLLRRLSLRDNQLSSLDVSENTNLELLFVDKNNLSFLSLRNNPNLSDLQADNILVSVGIEDNVDPDADEVEIDLSPATFVSFEANTMIKASNNYSYDASNKHLFVNNLKATDGYVETEPVIEPEEANGKNFKLKIANIGSQDDPTDDPTDPDDPVDPDEPTDPDVPSNPSDKDSGSEDGADDVNVPNTSGGKSSAKTPDTGAMRTEDNDSSSSTSYVLPVTIAVVVLVLVYVTGRKYLSRRRMNF